MHKAAEERRTTQMIALPRPMLAPAALVWKLLAAGNMEMGAAGAVVVVVVVAATPGRLLVLSVFVVKVLDVVEVVSWQHSAFAQAMGLSVQNPTLQVVFHASLLVM